MYWSTNHFNTEGKVAVIIGGSQGVGYELARKLVQRQCKVILVARTESKLKAKTDELNEHEAGMATYVLCDVSDYDAVEAMYEWIYQKEDLDPDFLFCCAGSATPKLFGDLTKKDLQMGIDLNYRTAANACHGWWSLIKKDDLPKKPRNIILFSSILGWFPFIGYASYAPMKQAIASLSVILRHELSPFGFRVSCVFAGNFLSEGFEEEERTKPGITRQIEGPSNAISGEECAQRILDQLSQGYDTITTDFIGWFLGCSVLGIFVPRKWNFFQILGSMFFALIGPLVSWDTNRQIRNYFATHHLHSSPEMSGEIESVPTENSSK